MKLNSNERKTYIINIIRNYLLAKHITYHEYTTAASHYFHLNIDNNLTRCIRISDHKPSTFRGHCCNIDCTIGTNTPKHKLRARVERTVTNAIGDVRYYSLCSQLEKVNQ